MTSMGVKTSLASFLLFILCTLCVITVATEKDQLKRDISKARRLKLNKIKEKLKLSESNKVEASRKVERRIRLIDSDDYRDYNSRRRQRSRLNSNNGYSRPRTRLFELEDQSSYDNYDDTEITR